MEKQGKGFVTFAQNTVTVNYLKLAYLQALNVKQLHKDSKYAVIVDNITLQLVTKKHRQVFDYVIEIPTDYNTTEENKFANEWQVFALTPFKETIKLESDLLFTRNIDHWWSAFRLRDIVLSTGCKTYRQEPATSRANRKFFDDNELPDVYNGLMYFRYSIASNKFFNLAQMVWNNWDYLKENVLKNCREKYPSTDVLYAVTAKIFGIEDCTIPSMDFINFIHMKANINGWSNDASWQEITMHQREDDMIRIHNLNQYYPVHYYDKSYCTNELINDYEQRRNRSSMG